MGQLPRQCAGIVGVQSKAEQHGGREYGKGPADGWQQSQIEIAAAVSLGGCQHRAKWNELGPGLQQEQAAADEQDSCCGACADPAHPGSRDSARRSSRQIEKTVRRVRKPSLKVCRCGRV